MFRWGNPVIRDVDRGWQVRRIIRFSSIEKIDRSVIGRANWLAYLGLRWIGRFCLITPQLEWTTHRIGIMPMLVADLPSDDVVISTSNGPDQQIEFEWRTGVNHNGFVPQIHICTSGNLFVPIETRYYC